MNTFDTRNIVYPDSDGQPRAENTLQFRWITTIQGGLDALFAQIPSVFVAGNLLWYPVEGDAATRAAPDAMVVLGRPKGERGSRFHGQRTPIAPRWATCISPIHNSLLPETMSR